MHPIGKAFRESRRFLGAVFVGCFLWAAGFRAEGAEKLTRLVAGEYFVGKDPGEGSGHPIRAEDGAFGGSVEGQSEVEIDLGSLPAGFHRVGVRYRDDAGAWSPVRWTDLEVVDREVKGEKPVDFAEKLTQLVAGEYFVGKDPGEGSGHPIRAEDGAFGGSVEGQSEVEIDLGSLPAGFHRVGVRYRDDAGAWSPVRWTDLEVVDREVKGE